LIIITLRDVHNLKKKTHSPASDQKRNILLALELIMCRRVIHLALKTTDVSSTALFLIYERALASYSLGHFRRLVGQRWQIKCCVLATSTVHLATVLSVSHSTAENAAKESGQAHEITTLLLVENLVKEAEIESRNSENHIIQWKRKSLDSEYAVIVMRNVNLN
jgi:hypothetical protein